MVEKKILLIVVDGMGDRPIPQLNHKTPLEVANKPMMDELAKRGITGIVDVIGVGIPPGSAPANIALLGYDPYKCYTGRGAFEALGLGLEVMPNDVAFRANFATVDDNLIVLDRRAGRYIAEADILAEAINDIKVEHAPEVKIIFKRGIEHRGVLILRGSGLSKDVSDTDPERENIRIQFSKPLVDTLEAKKTARILNEFTLKSFHILSNHKANFSRISRGEKPANIILCRGAGTLPTIEKFNERYGLKGICIAGVPLIKGVAKAIGLDVLNVEGATGGLDSNLIAKAKAAIKATKDYDFIFIHVKGADTASHDGLIEEKIKFIERVDKMIEIIFNELNEYEVYMAITADHCSPISIRDHSGDPVPLLIYAPNIIPDDVKSFSERECLKGGLSRLKGLDILPILLNYAYKMKKFGE